MVEVALLVLTAHMRMRAFLPQGGRSVPFLKHDNEPVAHSVLYPPAKLLPVSLLVASPLPSTAVPPKPHVAQPSCVNNRLAEEHPAWQTSPEWSSLVDQL